MKLVVSFHWSERRKNEPLKLRRAIVPATADLHGYLRFALKKAERQFLNAFEASYRALWLMKSDVLSQSRARLEQQHNRQAGQCEATEKQQPVASVETKKAPVGHHTREHVLHPESQQVILPDRCGVGCGARATVGDNMRCGAKICPHPTVFQMTCCIFATLEEGFVPCGR